MPPEACLAAAVAAIEAKKSWVLVRDKSLPSDAEADDEDTEDADEVDDDDDEV